MSKHARKGVALRRPKLLSLAIGLSGFGNLSAADYYIDPAGNDSNNGTSQVTPWQSLSKVNATTFAPGDRIFLKRGGTWYGSLKPQGSGDASDQITLGAYGTGAKPLIDAQGAGDAAIRLTNQEYWTIDGLEATNWAGGNGVRWGIRVEAWDGQVKHRIRILNNTVRDVRGVMGMPESDGTTGYWTGGIYMVINEPGRADEVLIDGNDVRNIIGEAISFWGEGENGGMNYANCSPNVVVRDNRVLHTSGDGILIYGTDNELVEFNEVGYVSSLRTTAANTAAAWPTRHINGVWQHNEVHHTSRWGNDGTAFDNDGYVSGTTIFQYNHSHDNEGGFIMEYKWDWSAADTGNTTVRYNISVNDSRVVASNRGGMDLYNNVFYAPAAMLGAEWTDASHRVNFRNNIFVAAGRTTDFSSQTFSYNTFNGGITRPTTANQNKTRDPLFVNPATSGDLAGFILQSGSLEKSSGTALPGNGSKDFWGSSVPVSPTQPHRGASQIASISSYTATPTYISVSGPSTVAVPFVGGNNATFTVAVRDQNFRLISSPPVTWSLGPAVAGCSVNSGGVVTVTSAAAAQRLAVVATSSALTGTFSFATASPVWTNSAGTGNWSTSDANWNGVSWVNSTSSNPVFNNIGGTIALTEPITGGTLSASFGGRESGSHDLILAGNNALSLSGISVNGVALGGNCDSIADADGQRLTLNNVSVAVASDVAVRRGSLMVKGNTAVSIGGTLLCSEFWGLFTIQDNASVTATGGLNFSLIANGVRLNGGTLATPFIHVGNANWDSSSGVHFNGGTVVASQDNSDFLQVYNNGDTTVRTGATIEGGGLIFNSGGHSVTIATALNGSGALTKTGAGALTLATVNTYTGGTAVTGGTLSITRRNALPGSGGISIGAGANLTTNGSSDDNTQDITSAITLSGGTLAAGIGTPAQNFYNGNPVGTWGNYYLAPGASILAAGNATSTISASLGVNGPGGFTPINVDGGSTLAISGNISGVAYVSWGGFAKSGDGTLVLSGSNKGASQGTVLSAGTVEFSGNSLPTNLRAYGGPTGYSADFQGNATLRWAAGNTRDISYENGATQVRIGDGVTATFDTNGNNVTLGTAFDPGSNKTGALTKTGAGTLTLAGANSYTGNTTVNGGSLTLAYGGSTVFRPTSNHTSNQITGTPGHPVNLDGQFYLDLSAADGTAGNTWTLVDAASVEETYGGSFTVASSAGPFTNSSGVWALKDRSITWTYTQSTGVFSATAADSYLNWINAAWPGLPDKSPNGDPDNDGVPNLLEYVLQGGDPSAPSPGILPEAGASETNFIFTFHRRNASTVDTTQVFQYGNDLTHWTDVPLLSGGIVSIAPNTPSAGIDEIVITVPKGDDNKLFGRLKATSSDMSRLQIGQPEIIYTDSQMPYTMDASWASLRENDGSMTVFETAMALNPYYFRNSGTPGDPLQTALAPYSLDYNGYNHMWPSGCWIPNIYKHTDGTLVGFVHREDLYPANGRTDGGNNFFIGLAKSTDGGLHWIYLGDVITTRGNGAGNAAFANLGGVPYLIVNGDVYLYFNEHEGQTASDHRFLAVARAKLQDIMAAVQAGQVPPFQKYSQGAWTEDGMTGLGSEVISGSLCRNDWFSAYDFHSDATYCKPLGRYLITVQTHGANLLKLYSSADGVDWRFEANLDFAPGCMLPYSSFISFDPTDSADSHDVGGDFYIYFTRKKLANYDDDTLCRIKCSIKPQSDK